MEVVNIVFHDNSGEVLDIMKEDAIRWLKAVGQDAAATAAKKAPVDTGLLKNSISYAVDSRTDTVYIGTNVKYAKWHEFGTGKYAVGGRKTPWAFQDKHGEWHYTHGVPARHFIQYGATTHAAEYGRILENILKGYS